MDECGYGVAEVPASSRPDWEKSCTVDVVHIQWEIA